MNIYLGNIISRDSAVNHREYGFARYEPNTSSELFAAKSALVHQMIIYSFHMLFVSDIYVSKIIVNSIIEQIISIFDNIPHIVLTWSLTLKVPILW